IRDSLSELSISFQFIGGVDKFPALRESDVLECVTLAHFVDRLESLEITLPEPYFHNKIAKLRVNTN
ncbi:hypothetical protein IRJ41_017539, partial [Triplophysa rosa]